MNKIQILVAVNFTKIEIRHSVFIFCGANGKQIKKIIVVGTKIVNIVVG